MIWRPREHRGPSVTKTWRGASVGRALIRPYSLARLCRKASATCAEDSGYAGDWRTVGDGIAHRSDLDSLGISNPVVTVAPLAARRVDGVVRLGNQKEE